MPRRVAVLLLKRTLLMKLTCSHLPGTHGFGSMSRPCTDSRSNSQLRPSDLSSSVDATHGLGVGAESVADDGVLDQQLLHCDDGDAVAVAAVDEDAAQSDVPRGVDVDAIAARLPAQHHLAASVVVRESRV